MPKIIKSVVHIGKNMFDRSFITATFDNGENKELFDFYPDEVMFSSNEFVDKTEEEARHLFFVKDKAYLKS